MQVEESTLELATLSEGSPYPQEAVVEDLISNPEIFQSLVA